MQSGDSRENAARPRLKPLKSEHGTNEAKDGAPSSRYNGSTKNHYVSSSQILKAKKNKDFLQDNIDDVCDRRRLDCWASRIPFFSFLSKNFANNNASSLIKGSSVCLFPCLIRGIDVATESWVRIPSGHHKKHT